MDTHHYWTSSATSYASSKTPPSQSKTYSNDSFQASLTAYLHDDHSSETSSKSEVSTGSGSMNHQPKGYRRRGRGGERGGKGLNRTYSSGSGSSNGRSTPNKLPLGLSSVARDCATTPDQINGAPNQIHSPAAPDKQQSAFDLNGHNISETYTARSISKGNPDAHRLSSPVYSQHVAHSPRNQHMPFKPIVAVGQKHWTEEQEATIKIYGLPKSYWIREVHQALSSVGTIVKIRMLPDNPRNSASVTFRPPPPHNALLHEKIRIGSSSFRWEMGHTANATIASPVDPIRRFYEFNILRAKSIDFGINIANNSTVVMHTSQPYGGIQVMLNLQRKELDVKFSLKIDDEIRHFRFLLPIALLPRMYRVINKDTGDLSLIIPFNSPPQVFAQKREGEDLGGGRKHTSLLTKDRLWYEWATWYRETDIVDDTTKRLLHDLPLMYHNDTAIIDIGRWTDYRLMFDPAVWDGVQFEDFSSALADFGVVIEDAPDYKLHKRFECTLWSVLQEEIAGTHPHLAPSSKCAIFDDLFAGQTHLLFSVRYQLDVCLSNGYLKEHTITSDFLDQLAAMEERRAVSLLEKVVDKQRIYYNPMDIFKIQLRGSLEKKVPSYCILQRSVIITPTMMHVASPAMETSNRIIRKYAANADRFIRVRFSDEKTEGPLRNMPNDRSEAVFARVRRAMKNGIVVAGRFYEFLAFGNSQFREHGAYFYAPTSSKSADDIRLSLGQFDHIKTVAKFGARLGQCFSTTRAMLLSVKICEIPDVTRNGYNFTDGVGKISLFLAQMAAQELGLANAFDEPPSLYQFRLGGCKGVLALDPTMSGNEVHIRPSQKKFNAEFNGLEIIRSSALATPFFNRQIIAVLSNLGVHNSVFTKKQQDMVNDYERAMADEDIALQKLSKHIDTNQTTITMAGMVLDGFMKSQEPFITSLLRLWRACTIKNLKEKARIAVDDGAFVLGCVDETATLKGHMNNPQSRLGATRVEKLATLPEIFLQIDDTSKKGHYKIIKGICILARNPSLHPGDIRIVRAVDVHALRHLKNVVVLPQTGDRDLANMCSGGDLDGDDYMVLWDADLIPRQEINEPPMDFAAEKQLESDKPITISDVSEFFVTYIKNDSLGQIAHAHLAQADIKPSGVKDDTCLALAKLHSQAVDYPKSGIAAVMDRNLKPSRWPHFMEKRHLSENKIYKSKKILGMLYDQVQLIDFEPQWENAFDERILNAYDLDNDLLSKAVEVKILYDEALKRLMAKHGIRTEFEAWSVFVLRHNHESRDYKFAEDFGRTVAALKAHFRDMCHTVTKSYGPDDRTILGRFVAAMYTVTAREMEDALKECRMTKLVGGQEVPMRPRNPEHMPLISFPWLFPSELGKIATETVALSPPEPLQGQPTRKSHLVPIQGQEMTGTVETEAGVTHYGELLSLDFSFAHSGPGHEPETSEDTSTVRSEQQVEIERDASMRADSSSKPLSTPHRSTSPPIIEPHEQDQDAKQRMAVVDENCLGGNGEETATLDRNEHEMKSQLGTEMEIMLDESKPSILERLMRLDQS